MEHFPLVDRLHTDVLEEKYGKINSKILVHNERLRLAHLVDSKGISRTFAITLLLDDWTDDIKKINSEIKKGEPIGKAFRKHEYAIRKNVLEVYKIKIPGVRTLVRGKNHPQYICLLLSHKKSTFSILSRQLSF